MHRDHSEQVIATFTSDDPLLTDLSKAIENTASDYNFATRPVSSAVEQMPSVARVTSVASIV